MKVTACLERCRQDNRNGHLMDTNATLILCIYLAIQSVELLLTHINLKHLAVHGNRVPTGFEKYVDKELLTRVNSYTLENGRVRLAAAVLDVTVTIVFLFGGPLNWYNNFIHAQGWPLTVSAIVFFVLLSIAGTLLHIPFDIYTTFHVERKYEFNRKSPGLWIADLVKGLVLSTILYSILVAVIFKLLAAVPGYWWLAGWLFLFSFSVFLLYISPSVLEPLFNKFTPITEPALESLIRQTMTRAGLAVSRVFSMDASKRSTHTNAYFTGIGRVKRIVLFDTLIKNHSPEEITAILAHEAGHWRKKHLLKTLLLTQSLLFVGFVIADQLIKNELVIQIFHIEQSTLYTKLFLIGFLGSLAVFPLKPLGSRLSRRHEHEADDFAVELTGDRESLATALIKLGRDNLANLHPHPWYAAVYYSHPPIVERVTRLRRP